MTFTPLFSTGFEMGTLPKTGYTGNSVQIVFQGGTVANIAVQTTPTPPSGTYVLKMNNQNEMYITFSAQAEIYVACRFYPDATWATLGYPVWDFVLPDGNYLRIIWDQANKRFQAYVNAVLAASGTIIIAANSWIHLQIHFKIDDAPNGLIETKIDGVSDISYSGDTHLGASTTGGVLIIKKTTNAGGNSEYDDIVIGTGDWAGDIRHATIVPTSDTGHNDWDRSSPGNDYSLIDEIPASTTDYIYTDVTAEEAMHGLSDVSMVYEPKWATLWSYMDKVNVSHLFQIKLIDSDGVNTNKSGLLNMSVGQNYAMKLLSTAPDGNAWDISKLNSLIVGIESSII